MMFNMEMNISEISMKKVSNEIKFMLFSFSLLIFSVFCKLVETSLFADQIEM